MLITLKPSVSPVYCGEQLLEPNNMLNFCDLSPRIFLSRCVLILCSRKGGDTSISRQNLQHVSTFCVLRLIFYIQDHLHP